MCNLQFVGGCRSSFVVWACTAEALRVTPACTADGAPKNLLSEAEEVIGDATTRRTLVAGSRGARTPPGWKFFLEAGGGVRVHRAPPRPRRRFACQFWFWVELTPDP
eukprot:scaffold235453_cov40-Tisochrysis_lutea.AAC.2